MTQAAIRMLRLVLTLVICHECVWSNSFPRLSAQATPNPPETFSVLESSLEHNESLPHSLPPQESLSESTPEPPSDSALAAEPEPIPESESTEDDPFANLFRDSSAGDALEPLEPPTPPSELDRNSQADSFSESLRLPIGSDTPWPTLPTQQGYAIILAGPVHEALLIGADVLTLDRERAKVSSAPPATLNEQAPRSGNTPEGRQVPQFVGNNVQWIGGYWAWLGDAEKYVWVSGVYRDTPPGRRWIAGSWSDTAAGYRWTEGYWAEANSDSAVSPYRQAPPAPRENVPNSLSPDDDSFWITGQWVAEQPSSLVEDTKIVAESGYQWQPGFWSKRFKEWIWQPSRYIDTPAGYVYVSGYWDYEPHDRGQAYAPVIFDAPELAKAEIAFLPRYPLSRPATVLLHLFTKSDSHHYFYGDLYDPTYAAVGYRPWYAAAEVGTAGGSRVEPLLGFYQWKYRSQGVDFTGSMTRFANHFRSAPSIRPATQLANKPQLADRDGLAGEVNANTFDEIVRGNVGELPTLMLPGFEQQPAIANWSRAAYGSTASAANQVANSSSTVNTASAFLPPQTGRADVPRAFEPMESQPVGASNPGLGTARQTVLLDGRITVAPAPIGRLGPIAPPAGMRMPSPPKRPVGFGSRLRRR